MSTDRAPVYIHNRFADRQPQAKPTKLPGNLCISLFKGIEHPGQEFGLNAHAGVAHFRRTVPPLFSVRMKILPPSGVNFAAFRRRFQKVCCNRAGSAFTRSLSACRSSWIFNFLADVSLAQV